VTQARLAVAAITIDFGNTLVRVDRPGLRAVVEHTAERLVAAGVIEDRERFLTVWVEERERQFREDVPEFREPDINHRAIRVLARLRGMAPPPRESRWDDAAASGHVTPGEIEQVVEAYGAEFVQRMDPVEDATGTLETLSGAGYRLAILSNWPLALTIDRFAEAHGWLPYLDAIVVSERVGVIKPHPSIFRAAEAALGLTQTDAASILHVGDDWAADVVGARQAGWRAAFLRGRQLDTPLPTSEPGDELPTDATVTPDLTIDELGELPALVKRASGLELGAVREGTAS
jgi:HAD superfamily hydrolase (TIGR01549 family)